MVYTEIKKRNNKKYYYRVISLRQGGKIKKQRVYLGVNLDRASLLKRVEKADHYLLIVGINNSIEKIKAEILPILKKNKIKKAGVFGSYAKGYQKKSSDVDLLVQPSKQMGFAFAGLREELAKSLKRKVDLVTYNGLSPYVRDKILKEEVRIL